MRTVSTNIVHISAVVLASTIGLTLYAQSSDRIDAAYDGYQKHADGSYTLWFGYYNHNRASVTIPPGPNNAFSPGPPDRNQPTTFQPGYHRFACTMSMPKEGAPPPQWTIKYGGAEMPTTAKVFDPLYQLEEQSVTIASRGIEGGGAGSAKSAGGVCVNRAPTLFVTTNPDAEFPRASQMQQPAVTAQVNQEVYLFGLKDDDGLPRDGKATAAWIQKSGPAPSQLSQPQGMRTGAIFKVPGDYVIELSASDGSLTGHVAVKVTVTP